MKVGTNDKKDIKILPLYYDHILETDYPVYILVGGRNSGKTHFMGQSVTMDINNCEDYKMLVVEDVETNINEGVKTNVLERIEDFGWGSIFHNTKHPAKIEHKINKNSILFKGYHSSKQQKRIKSLNKITAAWYEEAENITYEQFIALLIQLRGGNPKDRKLFLTMNPVNQDGFINKEFFEKTPDKIIKKFSDGRPKIFVRNIETEIMQALYKIDENKQSLEIDKSNEEQAQENYQQAVKRFENGVGTSLDVLRAETNLNQIRISKNQTHYQYIMSLYNLMHKTGTLNKYFEDVIKDEIK